MPEGDTLFKAAARLRPALAGHRLTRFEAPRLRGDRPVVGALIERVEARGKHLLIAFEGDVDDPTRRRVWSMAARQLQANLGHARRATHPGGLAVYGRQGQPCRRCGSPIRMVRHGDLARSTYWCPACQPRL